MKRSATVLALGLMLACSGCGSQVSQTTKAYEKCREAGYEDRQIGTIFSLCRIGRDEGGTASEAIGAACGNLSTPEGTIACTDCLTAIAEAVWD